MSKTLSTSLRDTTKLLLKNRKKGITLKDVEEATGIDEGWLKSFLNKKDLEHPSVCRIETLYEFFTGRQLQL